MRAGDGDAGSGLGSDPRRQPMRTRPRLPGPSPPQPLHPASPPPTPPGAGDVRAAGLRAAERRPLPERGGRGEAGWRCRREGGKPAGVRPPCALGEGELNAFQQTRRERRAGLRSRVSGPHSPRQRVHSPPPRPQRGPAARSTCSGANSRVAESWRNCLESERPSPAPHSPPAPSLIYKHHPPPRAPRSGWRQTS